MLNKICLLVVEEIILKRQLFEKKALLKVDDQFFYVDSVVHLHWLVDDVFEDDFDEYSKLSLNQIKSLLTKDIIY
jgi:hypothetical protein